MSSSDEILGSDSPDIYQVQTKAKGPGGSLPVTEDLLLNRPSGDLFGLTQNAGMGWEPAEAARKQFLILSTQGGLARAGRQTDRAGLSHRALGNRLAGAGGGGGIRAGCKPFLSPVIAPIRAMAGRRERRGCLTVCRIGMMPR